MLEQTILSSLPQLTALRVSNGALAAKELPARLKILNWGKNETVKGTFIVDDSTIAALAANQASLGFERVALDYEHNTVPGSPEYERTAEPRAVAGYGKVEVIPQDGLYLTAMAWTPSGQKKAKNFEDISPAVGQDTGGRVNFVHSAALVRNGAAKDVTFFSAAPSQNKIPNTMTKEITLPEIAAALGLAAEATKTDVLAKLKTLSAGADAFAAMLKDGKLVILSAIEDRLKPLEAIPSILPRLEALEAGTAKGITTLSATVDGKVVSLTPENIIQLSTRVATLEGNLTTALAANTAAECAQLITRLAADGKVPLDIAGKPYSTETLKTLPIDTLKLLHANTPATVPLSARGARAKDGGRDTTLKGRERVIAAFAAAN